jgi:hypothetical protein
MYIVHCKSKENCRLRSLRQELEYILTLLIVRAEKAVG